MSLRVKSSVLRALGSLLTLILLCHILKLGTKERVHTRYLDSTEITNYTLLESLLSVKLNDDRTQFTDFTPTKVDDNHIQYSLEELKHLSMAASFNSNLNTTVLIQYYSETELNNQLDSILLQSFIPSSVLVVCSRNETAMINRLIQEKEQELHLYDTIHAIEATSTKGYWFSGIEQSKVLSDYVIIMDKGVLPGEGYFDLMLRLLQTPVFEHALIGTESPSCQQTNEKARYVKSLDSVWVLRREWYLTLAESKQKTSSLSQTLYSRFQIPSIQLPRLMDQQKLLGKTNSKNDGTEATICQDKNEGPIMFFMDNQSSAAFEKLVCEFGEKMQVIHIVDTVDSNIPMLPSCSFEQNAVYIHHTINQIKNDFNNMINQLSPRVVIYEQNENKVDFKNELLLSTTAASKVPTFIQLPRMKDTSIVSWMTDLSVEALEQWHTPSIKLMVVTSGYKKAQQVKRIFKSIKNADYLSDKVDVSILMNEKTDSLTSKFANNLQWTVGEKSIRHRISGAHPMQIFAEAWYPSSDHEYAVMLDDRVELSDQFYIWIKYNLLKYRYSGAIANNNLFGISLYSPLIIDTDPTGRQLLYPPKDDYPYLMQATSGSGALYFPEHWREFHDYITARLTDQSIVKRGSGNRHLFKDSLLTISRSNRWINSWRKYFDEMIYMRGYVMLYPPSQSSFSTLYITNTNLNQKKKEAYTSAEKLYHVPLTQNKKIEELPEYEQLSVLDLHGKLSNQTSLIEKGQALQRKFSSCEPRPYLNHDPSDMLCPFSQLVEIPIIDSNKDIPVKNVYIYH